MRTAIVTVNSPGKKLALRLKNSLDGSVTLVHAGKGSGVSLREAVGNVFSGCDGIVFVAALGIVVRSIVPFVRNKLSDPAVVCVDTAGRFSVSVISGHEGGANSLAYRVASCIDAVPVITTGTEAHKKYVIGIGCRRGVSGSEVKRAVRSALRGKNIKPGELRLAATIDIKKDEEGLLEACAELGLPITFISKDRIKGFRGDVSVSAAAMRAIGVEGVCEPCALLAGRRAKLLLRKKICGNVTVAIAREN